jgi:hypothetical protein
MVERGLAGETFVDDKKRNVENSRDRRNRLSHLHPTSQYLSTRHTFSRQNVETLVGKKKARNSTAESRADYKVKLTWSLADSV